MRNIRGAIGPHPREISLLVRPISATLDPAIGAVAGSVAEQRLVALATLLDAPEGLATVVGAVLAVWPESVAGSLGAEGLDAAVTADARGELAQGMTAQRHYGPQGQRRMDQVSVFLQSFAPPPRLLVFGAIDFAAAVTAVRPSSDGASWPTSATE